jgi:hypothetical protein
MQIKRLVSGYAYKAKSGKGPKSQTTNEAQARIRENEMSGDIPLDIISHKIMLFIL